MVITKNRRTKKPNTAIDLSALKAAVDDGKCWSCMGLVVKGEDGEHFELSGDDVLIEVEVMPSGDRITARLGSAAGGANKGVWTIPKLGTEVAVLVPDGEYGFMPIIVSYLSTGDVPNNLAEDVTIIENTSIKLGHDASEAVIKGNDYTSKESTFLTSLDSFLDEIVVLQGEWDAAADVPESWTPDPDTQDDFIAAVNSLISAISTFKSGLNGSLSAKVDVE